MQLTAAHPHNYPRLVEVWEAAVRATHHFLPEADLLEIRAALASQYFPLVDLTLAQDEHAAILGFVGVADDKIEMLFVDPAMQGRGVGKALLEHAIQSCQAVTVDVNEQNPQAVGFYLSQGFVIEDRSELDGQGRPYPLLHLRLADAG